MGRKPTPPHIRVLDKIKVNQDGCWMFTGSLSGSGYARVRISQKKKVQGHRAVYEAFVGPIPEGLDLDHLCHNQDPDCKGGDTCRHRACCNPAHLQPATRHDNLAKGMHPNVVARRTGVCKRGHSDWIENGQGPSRPGATKCRICQNERQRAYYWRKKAEVA